MMRTSPSRLCLAALLLAIVPSGMAEVVVEYAWSEGERYEGLAFSPGDDDLIAWMTIDAGAWFEGGFVDPANGVEAFNFNGRPDGCLEMWYDDPLDCFWHGYGDPGGCEPEWHMLDLTDGSMGVFAPILRDFARANLVARYDLGGPRDIDEVRVFSRMAGRDVRVFQHYDLYVSHDSAATWVPVARDVMNGTYGAVNFWQYATSYTRVRNPTGVLAENATNIRFVFYAVGLDQNFSLVDVWQGYANDEPAFGVRCSGQVPAEPGDLDGLRKAFVSTFVDEMDVIGWLQGDGDGDLDLDLADLQAMLGCLTGPGGGPVATPCRPFDFSPKDGDVDLADVAVMQRCWPQ